MTPATRPQKNRLFGTDGVRGIANVEPMTVETAVSLGRSAAHVFKDGTHRHKILIGKDTRLSGYMIESALIAGVCSMGVDAIVVGPLPSPGIAFATRSLRADAGIMISASHNPYVDNGIKFFSREGFKLDVGLEQQIEDLTFTGRIDDIRPTAGEVGKAFRIDDVGGRYVEFLKRSVPRDFSLEGMRIVVDGANGAAYKVGPALFAELGASVIPIGVQPNGTNINDGVGSLHLENAAEQVLMHGADLAICLDGDADRCLFADGEGRAIDGDRVLAISGRWLKDRGELANNTAVATVMSNLALDLSLREVGVHVERTQVGDRFVVECMRANGHRLGGEQSGHMVYLDHNTTGDGLLTALQLLRVIADTGKSLAELSRCMDPMPQVLLNVEIADRRSFDELPTVTSAIASAEDELGDRGRVLVRYSGTQPMVRVMVEGENLDRIEGLAGDIAGALKATIGAA